MTTDTPRTDTCNHCGSPRISPLCAYFTCEADTTQRDEDKRTHLCREREMNQKLEAEVERLKDRLNDCLSFVAFHGPVGATPDTAKLLEVRILATLNPTDK